MDTLVRAPHFFLAMRHDQQKGNWDKRRENADEISPYLTRGFQKQAYGSNKATREEQRTNSIKEQKQSGKEEAGTKAQLVSIRLMQVNAKDLGLNPTFSSAAARHQQP